MQKDVLQRMWAGLQVQTLQVQIRSLKERKEKDFYSKLY